MFKTVFNTMYKIVLDTNKIWLIYKSFLKITDPKKIVIIVNEFLKTRQNIQKNFLSERVDDFNTQYEFSKLFKQVTDMQKDLKET